MKRSTYDQLTAIAERQHGVLSARDIAGLGVPRTVQQRLVDAGRLTAPAPGVFVVAGSPDSIRRRMAVAVLSMRSLAALSHDTAAESWGLTDRGVRRIHIVTTRWDRLRRADVTVHESLDLVEHDVVIRHGLPTTSPQRTVVDLGATNRWVVEQALDTGIRQGLFTVDDVEAVVQRVARRGRRGVGVVRPLIEARRRWDERTESALEDLFLKTIERLGLPLPTPQYVVRDGSDDFVCRADFAYPHRRILIELDSEAYHMDRGTFRKDRSKQNRAMVLGWTVLRFTWWHLEEEPFWVARLVREALDATDTG